MNKEKDNARFVENFRKITGFLALLVSVCGVVAVFGSATFRPPIEVRLADAEPVERVSPLPLKASAPVPSPAADFTASETVPAPAELEMSEPEITQSETEQEMPEPEAVPNQDAPAPAAPYLASVNLDADTQTSIFALCDNDKALFCAVMAIAREETGFNPTASGDSGRCVGMMQINRNFRLERMEKLNVTDLTDPVQCAAVAIDYLRELSETFGWVEDHGLYLAYNAGPVGAENLRQAGVCSTRYTYEVLRYYREYMEEIENMEGGSET